MKKTPTNKVKCNICGKMLSKNYIKTHIKNIHGKEKEKIVSTNNKLVVKKGPKKGRRSRKNSGSKYEGYETVTDDELNDLMNGVCEDDFKELEVQFLKMNVNDDQNNNNSKRGSRKESKSKGKKYVVEQDVQLKLEKKLGFGHKNTPAGEIDILSDTELIEIKHWRGWHHAIGQLMVYGHYYPNHMKHIHFFGNYPSEDKLIVIKTICASLGIKISWEKN